MVKAPEDFEHIMGAHWTQKRRLAPSYQYTTLKLQCCRLFVSLYIVEENT
jgi:hypothetical protein